MNLPKERTGAAADRTLIAWIRTFFSLIAFGFGISKIIRTIETTRIGKNINPHYFSNPIGLAFISIGIVAMYATLKDHCGILRQIQSDRYPYASSAIAERVDIALLIVGLISFLAILIKAMSP